MGGMDVTGEPEPAGAGAGAGEQEQRPLPMLPGFRDIALRRMAGERRRLVAELAAQRQSAGLSQTQVAARMGTSQSAVARIEAGDADVRASTLERYAAAVGSHLSWRLQVGMPDQPAGGPGGSR
jgi:DNA-binding XRE family transcriptional regulator